MSWPSLTAMPGRLLAPVLQGVDAVVGEMGDRQPGAVHPEHAARFSRRRVIHSQILGRRVYGQLVNRPVTMPLWQAGDLGRHSGSTSGAMAARHRPVASGPVIDLHTHSTVSDGSDDPGPTIPELAAATGCSCGGAHRSRPPGRHRRGHGARAGELGVELIPGVEISCEHTGTMHVLVYFLEPGEGPLQDELVRLQQARDSRNRNIADLMASLGLPVTYEEIEAEAGGMGAGRPHMAAILVRKGVVSSIQEAFDQWLAKGRPAYLDKERLHRGGRHPPGDRVGRGPRPRPSLQPRPGARRDRVGDGRAGVIRARRDRSHLRPVQP